MAALWIAGCASPEVARRDADEAAGRIMDRYGRDTLGPAADRSWFALDRPSDLLRQRLLSEHGLPYAVLTNLAPPRATAAERLPDPVPLSLVDAVKIGVRNSRDYQDAKEAVFRVALELELQCDAFRTSWAGLLSGGYDDARGGESDLRAATAGAEAGATRALKTGGAIAGRIAVDLVRLLTGDRDRAMGLLADATVTLPLLRGAGRAVVTEPLTQAERNVVYAMLGFDRFRQTYAVRVAQEYYDALDAWQRVENSRDNLDRLTAAVDRAREMALAGRLPAIEVAQTRQDQLRAQDRLFSARFEAEGLTDSLKTTIGLPPDARVQLDMADLDRLPDPGGADAAGAEKGSDPTASLPPPPDETEHIRAALEHRQDLRVALGRAEDARRAARVAADALRADAKLEMTGAAGEARSASNADGGDAGLGDAQRLGARLEFGLPWERTKERIAYRNRLIDADRAGRAAEEAEDAVKRDVLDAMRSFDQAARSCVIQAEAVRVAMRRVDAVNLFQMAGRAQTRDLLEAQEALLSARNALSSARIARRMSALNLARDTGRLALTEEGFRHDTIP